MLRNRALRLLGPLCLVGLLALVPSAAHASTRGQGTMQVHQPTDCSGSGNASSVTIPFSVLFTGFEPNATGTATAYTQPGGIEVGSADITLGPDGSGCYKVTGEVEPGQYKIVYDFGSGTGKQKVIRIEGGSAPSPTPTPSLSPTATASPTASPTSSASISPTPSSTASATGSPSASASGSASPSGSVLPTSSASPSGSGDPGDLEFTAVDPLARTGGSNLRGGLAAGVALVLVGVVLVLVSRRGRPSAH